MKHKTPIYLDYMATTPVDPEVCAAMLPYLCEPALSGNPASNHEFGRSARLAVEQARKQVADLINVPSESIVFTSGATEALNLAIKGAASFHRRKGRHIITSQIEHKAVLDTCHHLSQQGFEVDYLHPSSDGQITPSQIQAALRNDTVLVIIMAANNEIGTIYDIAGIGQVVRQHGAWLVVDAAQAAGKIKLDADNLNVDLLAISGHKLYGPKGVGALYIRQKPRVRIHAEMHGGGHERGLRSGTLPTHQLVGLGMACALAKQRLDADMNHVLQLSQHFWNILKNLERISLNGPHTNRLPNNLNLCLHGIDAEALLAGLPHLGLSTASACNSIIHQASYVLKAIGLSDHDAFSSIRVSFGRLTTFQEVERAAHDICNEIMRLRQLAPC